MAPETATWSCVGEESTHSTGQLVIDIVPAEDCSADVNGTVRVTNTGQTECGSDVMVSLGDARIWMESTSGYGAASGTWAPMPDDMGEAVGYVAYPPGVSEWTVRLPNLSPGQYLWKFIPAVSCGNANLSPLVDVEVVLSGSVSEQAPMDLFADHERWVATDLDGRPVVGGPVIESADTADFTPTDRLGQIAGCALDAASWAFNLEDGKLVTDPFANADFDCDLVTGPSQAEKIRRLVFEEPTVEVIGRELQLRNGSNTLTFQPER